MRLPTKILVSVCTALSLSTLPVFAQNVPSTDAGSDQGASQVAKARNTSPPANTSTGNTDSEDAALIQSGRYLAVAADCAACHTAQHGQPFAGGYPVASPMGTIYSTNITPSTKGGIGDYTEDEFSRALRQGIRRDGAHLYPAMPYTDYAGLTDQDIHALYTYFHTVVVPVDSPAPRTMLKFPFNIRASLGVWNMLYLHQKPFVPDPAKSALVNRGAYLTNALEHCAACHTPRDVLMGQGSSNPFAGGSLGSWYAPNISSDPVAGIGGWSDQALKQYLRTGSVPGKAQAAGPMAEAIDHSLQYLSNEDIDAIVAYLKQTHPAGSTESKPRFAYGQAFNESAERGNAVSASRGWQIFSGSCAACHQANGGGVTNEGTQGNYPSLYHNTATGASNPDNLIATILFGLNRSAAGKPAFMPAFGPGARFTDRLSDQDVADVANFVLTQYGNPAVKVNATDVATVRLGGAVAPLAKIGALALPGMLVLLLLIIVIAGLVVWSRKRARAASQDRHNGDRHGR